MSESPFMTVKEVALFLKISRRAVYQHVSNETMPFGRIGGSIRFHRDEVMAWWEASKTQAQPEQKLGTLEVAGIR